MKLDFLVAGIAVGALLLSTPPAMAREFPWHDADTARLTSELAAGTYGRVTSAWIEQHGKPVYAQYFEGAGPETLHNTRSVGKTVTGMLLGAAIDDGLIDGVGAKAAGFFEASMPFDNPDPRKDAITIEDLATMSGPLECDDWNRFSRGNEERMYLVEDWSAFFWNLPIKNRPSWEIPETDGGFGRTFTYCTAGVQLIGEIVERAAGQPVPEYAARRLFDRIGIGNARWNHASTGQAHLGGGLELTTEAWARLGRLYASGGRWDGEQVISAAWVEASLRDRVRIDENTNYGYLWWRPAFDLGGETHRAAMMSGSGGNRVWVLPAFGLVVVLTKNDFGDREAQPKSDRFFAREIVARLRPGD